MSRGEGLAGPGRRVLLALSAALLTLLATDPALGDEVDTLVAAAMQREQIPGVAILVMRSGKVLRASGYGLANIEHGVPVKRDTLFQTGSLGKQFTAGAVLMLLERGSLALEDPISKY